MLKFVIVPLQVTDHMQYAFSADMVKQDLTKDVQISESHYLLQSRELGIYITVLD